MTNIFGIPKELKLGETRVALTPDAVNMLAKEDCEVLIETHAGELSGFSDDEYKKAGAVIIDTKEELWQKADFIIKVKEPQEEEYKLFRQEQVVFSYFHLAVEEKLTDELLKNKICAIACEAVKTEDGELPLLRPMSEVAGRMSIQLGASYLEQHNGGLGTLLGGVPGVQPAKVVIIGGGVVGINAAKTASGLGADVSVLDVNSKRLAEIDLLFGGKVKTYYSNTTTIMEECKKADLLIGAVLIPNKKAPKLVSADVIKSMKKGSVVIDVAIDQGGIIETIDKVTSFEYPIYEKYGVLHCAIPNIPSAVPKTSSQAYAYAILPYVRMLAQKGIVMALKECESLRNGVTTMRGHITCEDVAQTLNREHTEISLLVGFNV